MSEEPMRCVRIGIVGAGQIGQTAHIPGYLSCPDAVVSAVVDPDAANRERGQDLVEEGTGLRPTGFSSLEELIESQLVDAVSVAVPNVLHVPLSLKAVRAGLHVLVEKPAAVSGREALDLEEAARQAGVVAMVGQTHRYRDDVTALKRFVDAGRLGRIYHADARILRRRGTPTGWFTDKALSGGGPLMDIGVHALDVAWWLMGKPEPYTVLGHVHRGIGQDHVDFVHRWQALTPGNQDNAVYDTEDFAVALIRFRGGATLSLTASWNVNGAEDDRIVVNVYGTEAGISLDPPVVYGAAHHVLTDQKLRVGSGHPHRTEMHHFVECVRTGTTPISPVSDAVTVARMLESIALSSRSFAAVVLGETPSA